MIIGAQRRAARAPVEWTREKLASNSGVDGLVVEAFERRVTLPDQKICDTLQTTLEQAGAVFIAKNAGGIGVRQKLNRSEVKGSACWRMRAASLEQMPFPKLRPRRSGEFGITARRCTFSQPARCSPGEHHGG